ncbi:MAG: type II toxin-antitoxin system prevent-host-death family antitoxin [Desulfosporosinus sp.]|nr:type II toxin-antitoxin system prevent-host-death family antitoxin [Desulfosporosinus sp.]
MIITATEFKLNVGKYLALAEESEIIINKNGKSVVKLCPAKPSIDEKINKMKSFFGSLSDGTNDDVTAEQLKEERLQKYECTD